MSKQKTWGQKKEQLKAQLLSQGGLVRWAGDRGDYHEPAGGGNTTWAVFDPKGGGLRLVEKSTYPWWGKEVVELYYEAHTCQANHLHKVEHWGIRLATITLHENGSYSWDVRGGDVFISGEDFLESFKRLQSRTIEMTPNWAAMVQHPLFTELLRSHHGEEIVARFKPTEADLVALLTRGERMSRWSMLDIFGFLGLYNHGTYPPPGGKRPPVGTVVEVNGERRLTIAVDSREDCPYHWYVVL